jgi:cytochrome c biogenesis protein CcmG, thiol:disulfide interchange protein DsbE
VSALSRRQALLLAPLGLAAAGGLAFWAMLRGMGSGRFDPHAIGDPMLGRPIPDFSLPGLVPGGGFSAATLRDTAARTPILVNFFASWCVPCLQEADPLAALARSGVPIWGIAYKDTDTDATRFLARAGNPYLRTASDAAGRVAIDFGVYGVPESFLIDRHGRIAWHLAGPLSADTPAQGLTRALQAAAA